MNNDALFDVIREANSQRQAAGTKKRTKKKMEVEIGEALLSLLKKGVDWPDIQRTLELDDTTLSTFQTFSAAEKRRDDRWHLGFIISFVVCVCLPLLTINSRFLIVAIVIGVILGIIKLLKDE